MKVHQRRKNTRKLADIAKIACASAMTFEAICELLQVDDAIIPRRIRLFHKASAFSRPGLFFWTTICVDV